MNRRDVFQIGLAAGGLLLTTGLAYARSPSSYPGVSNENGIAIGGADPVSYFRDGQMVAGSAVHSLKWRGATWYFASADNMATFEADPRGHAPQFGGYCAYGMSKGELFAPDPEAWVIRDTRLYLAKSPAILAAWNQDPDAHILRARANWAMMKSES